MVGGGQRKIEGWMAGLAFAIIQAAVLIAIWSGALTGSTATKFEAQAATLTRHELRLDGLEERERQRLMRGERGER